MSIEFLRSIRVEKPYPATIDIKFNDNYCGEGYQRHCYDIRFDEGELNSGLWYEDDGPSEDHSIEYVNQDALEHYKLVVELINRIRTSPLSEKDIL